VRSDDLCGQVWEVCIWHFESIFCFGFLLGIAPVENHKLPMPGKPENKLVFGRLNDGFQIFYTVLNGIAIFE
jgi:hypothetical protein